MIIIAIINIIFILYVLVLISILLIKGQKKERERYEENKRFKEAMDKVLEEMVYKNKKLPLVQAMEEDGWNYCEEHHRFYINYCMECLKDTWRINKLL